MSDKQLKGIDKKIHDMVVDELKRQTSGVVSVSSPSKTPDTGKETVETLVRTAVEGHMKNLLTKLTETVNQEVKESVKAIMETFEPTVVEAEELRFGLDVVSFQGPSVKPQVITVHDNVVDVHNVVHTYTSEDFKTDDLKAFSLTEEGKYVFLLLHMPSDTTLNKKYFQVNVVDEYGKETSIHAGFVTTEDGVSALMAVPVSDTLVHTTLKVYWNGTKDTADNVTKFHVNTTPNSIALLLKK